MIFWMMTGRHGNATNYTKPPSFLQLSVEKDWTGEFDTRLQKGRMVLGHVWRLVAHPRSPWQRHQLLETPSIFATEKMSP